MIAGDLRGLAEVGFSGFSGFSGLDGLGAGADDFNTRTAQSLTEICENPQWYDWINPGVWVACLPGDLANVYQMVKGDWGTPMPTGQASQPPSAPQTEDKMRSWTPEDIAEAQAQQQRQYQRDMEAIRAGNGQLPVNYNPDDPKKTDWTPYLILAGVGVVLVAGVLIGRKG